MKMKKIASIIISMAFVIALAGCGNSAVDGQNVDSGDNQNSAVIDEVSDAIKEALI